MSDILTVTQVNRYVAQLFRRDAVLRAITVEGEISDCKYHSSGHVYFTIKDAGASLNCVMFASDRAGLKIRLEAGMNVQVTGSVAVYEQAGRYQLYAKKITPAGAGNLYEQFQKLKEKLAEEGLFAEEYKRPLPVYAKTVGIVTAPTGAAVRDIIQIAQRRNPYTQLVLYPAIVQGEAAPESIAKGIAALEAYGVDVIIAGRGGGSMEDLWAFNEEIVARAIFNCTVPVVSAVGHETDVTIADFCADLRAPTPSAAAELTVFDYSAFAEDTGNRRAALLSGMRDALRRVRTRLALSGKELQWRGPQERIRQMKLTGDRKREALENAMQSVLQTARQGIVIRAERMHGVSPLTRFKSGYGYLTGPDRKRITSVSQAKEDRLLEIYLTDGRITAKTVEIMRKNWEKEYRV